MMKNQRTITQISDDLKLALTREASNVIAIGNLLLEAKDTVDYGEWLSWLKANFGESKSTAENYMNAARLASRFPTVRNLKLRPTTLYLLGSKLDGSDPLFTPEAIEAVLKAAESEWVNPARASAIAQPPELSDQEIDDIFDGPPQEVPPAPEPTVSDVNLPPFDSAVATLARLQTKPLSSFIGTAHTPDQIESVIAFLLAVSDAITKRKAA